VQHQFDEVFDVFARPRARSLRVLVFAADVAWSAISLTHRTIGVIAGRFDTVQLFLAEWHLVSALAGSNRRFDIRADGRFRDPLAVDGDAKTTRAGWPGECPSSADRVPRVEPVGVGPRELVDQHGGPTVRVFSQLFRERPVMRGVAAAIAVFSRFVRNMLAVSSRVMRAGTTQSRGARAWRASVDRSAYDAFNGGSGGAGVVPVVAHHSGQRGLSVLITSGKSSRCQPAFRRGTRGGLRNARRTLGTSVRVTCRLKPHIANRHVGSSRITASAENIVRKRFRCVGGEGGIRTHVPLTGQDAFEAPPLRPLRYLSGRTGELPILPCSPATRKRRGGRGPHNSG
jgi:hypothetical protein